MSGNEAAFPQSHPDDVTRPIREDNPLSRGLTKREYTAIHILQALLSGTDWRSGTDTVLLAVSLTDDLLANLHAALEPGE
jgi:hypothetical protein